MERRPHRRARRGARGGRARGERRRPAWPKIVEDDKRIVWGSTAGGRLLQVVYVLDPDDTVFVIHAMELPPPKKRQYRRRKR